MKNRKDEIKLVPQYEEALDIFNKRWQPLIIDVLYQKSCGFSEISRIIVMISDRMLAKRLKELEDVGVVVKISEENSKKVTYCLTEKGQSLARAAQGLKKWAKKWL